MSRYRCQPCRDECRLLLDLLGVEPGRISGALARLVALLATVAPYPVAARLAGLLLGVTVSPMGIWRVAQRLGEAAAHDTDALSRYHADSRATRRRRQNGAPLVPLPPAEEGHFREVKTGVLLLPSERVETSPGRRSVVCRFLVTFLGVAGAIFARLYAQLRELGWVGAHTVVVVVGGPRGYPAEWIWNRASMFVRRYLRLGYGIGSGAVESAHKQVASPPVRRTLALPAGTPGAVTPPSAETGFTGVRASRCAVPARSSYAGHSPHRAAPRELPGSQLPESSTPPWIPWPPL